MKWVNLTTIASTLVANMCSAHIRLVKGFTMERWRLIAIVTIVGVLILTFVFAELLGAPGV